MNSTIEHKLVYIGDKRGDCACGQSFIGLPRGKRKAEGDITDSILDSFNAHLASLRESGRLEK